MGMATAAAQSLPLPNLAFVFLFISIPFQLLYSPASIIATASAGDDTANLPVPIIYTPQEMGETSASIVLVRGKATIGSRNGTFALGFFNPSRDAHSRWYLGIWYASIPTPTYVWVANRETPVTNVLSSSVQITTDGKLSVLENGTSRVWSTNNSNRAVKASLTELGNFVLLDAYDHVVWQSFDNPTDTWLPGMNLTTKQWLTSWKSLNNPSAGAYSLRLKPPLYGEIELVYADNRSYWSTENWTGNAFAGVPEMIMPYIYKFSFVDPYTPTASFGYREISLKNGEKPPLTRFGVDPSGRLMQYTWWQQAESWNMFWSRPENPCRVYGLCGNFGFCNDRQLSSPCSCPEGLKAADVSSLDARDFSSGCRRESDDSCDVNDEFQELDAVSYDAAIIVSFPGSRSVCETRCLANCSCIGLYHNEQSNICTNFYNPVLNLRNRSSDSTIYNILYVRVPKGSVKKKSNAKIWILIGTICGFLGILMLVALVMIILRKRRVKELEVEEEAGFSALNLMVFSYKELYAATRGFSEKLGHGGFGTVFRGELLDSLPVAVKRLERPGSGEKEFRAEVCTIGNIQHVNLVRLRGFCSENSHRLLVYDFMPNGPLSSYLKRDGPNMGWDVRFRIAVGTARAIAYLHEECRNCIIHCDIKPENILLDEDFSAKVSDFGLAKLLGRDYSRVLATMRGTWGYVAPEWISGVAITTKADVYSYGMTLLELIGGRRNVERPSSVGEGVVGEKWFFPPWAAGQIIEGNVSAVVDERLGVIYNLDEAERIGMVAVWCIQDEEAMRPTMGMVVKMLEGVLKVTVPPPPKLLQALVAGESFHGVGIDLSNKQSSAVDGFSDADVQLSRESKTSQSTP